jgi:methyl-accepting chemotaxis protein
MRGAGRDPRSKIFIDPTNQVRIASGLSALPVLTLIGATVAVALLGSRVLNEARSLDAEITSLFPLFLALVLLILSAGGLVALQAVRYSHRIAGPSYRLLQSLERIKRGNLEFRVDLREGDELQELADGINSLMDWLAEHPPQGIWPEVHEPDNEDSLDLGDREEVSTEFSPAAE